MKYLLLLSTLLVAFAGFSCRKSGPEGGGDGDTAVLRIVPYREGDLWGFAKPNGKIIIQPAYQSAYLLYDGYGRIYDGEHAGLVSPEGKVLIEPKYVYISEFLNDRAVFRTHDGKSGFLDTEGKVAIEAKYDEAQPFQGDFAVVKQGEQYLLIRPDGSTIKSIGKLIPFEMEPFLVSELELTSADPDYFLVQDTEAHTSGLVNKTGDIVLEATYESLSLPVNGILAASIDGKFGLLRVDGSAVTPLEYGMLYRTGADRFIASSSEDRYGVIDSGGKVIIPFEYSSIGTGADDHFIAYRNEAAGMLDNNGQIIVPFEYATLYYRQNRLIAYNQNLRCGVISTDNQVLIPFDYDEIDVLAPNRYLVGKDGKRGIIDDKGAVLLPIEYDPAYLGGESHEYVESMERPVNVVLLFKNGVGRLFNAEGKQLSDKYWLYCGFPDQFGLTLATDANGRDNYIGPAGFIYAVDAPLKKITVNNAQALFDAIGNDTEITLENGTYDLGMVNGSSEFAAIYDFAEYNMPDRTVLIKNAVNLHIKAKNPGKAHLVTSHVFVPVLKLYGCQNISLTGLVIGHEVEPGLCEGAVIAAESVSYLHIDQCDLYGSGTVGLEASACSWLRLRNSTIRECTRGILELDNCYALLFENCTMKDNEGNHMVSVSVSHGLTFDGVQFVNNHTPKEYGPYEFFRVSQSYQSIVLKNCSFTNCSSDYYATFPAAVEEMQVDRKGLQTAKGLWLQKEMHQ